MEKVTKGLTNWLSSEGITQKDVAEKLGVSEQFVNALFNGRREFGKKTGQPILDAVGLTFEQFGRMAMLAQGQFASFLTGDKKERESILEQLTNTEHFTAYGEAIKRLFDNAKTAQKTAQTAFDTEKEHTLPSEQVEQHNKDLDELKIKEKDCKQQIDCVLFFQHL